MMAGAIATAFVRHDGEVLAVRRSDDAGALAGRWDGVSAVIDGDEDPVAAAHRAVREAVGLGDPVLVRTGDPLDVAGADREALGGDGTLEIHPVLFETVGRDVAHSDDRQDAEWLPPTELLRRDVVPRLFEGYQRVAPTVQSVAADDEHGAATLSIRALEILRDRAGLLAAEGESDVDELRSLGDRLREARPSMAVLRNRVNRALAEAGTGDAADATAPTPADVERAAIEGINRALAADVEAGMRAAGLVSGWHVLTLSRSGTVLDALQADTAAAISIAESRPACEGIDVAETLVDGIAAADGDGGVEAPVTVHTDAAVAHRLATVDVDAVLVGADAILPDGSVVNKTGTHGAAIAAAREGVPVYVAAASDKVTTREQVNLESGHPTAVYDGDATIDVANPTFDVTPADAVAGIVTERGVLDPDEIAAIVEELRTLAIE